MIPKLGKVLIDRGLLSTQALDAALAVRSDEDALLGEILLRQGAISEEDLSTALQEQHGVDFRSLGVESADPQLAQLIPESLARNRLALPIAVDGTSLILAMVRPDDLDTITEIELLTGYAVDAVVTSSVQMLAALERCFDENVAARQTLVEMRIDEIRSGNAEIADVDINQNYDANDAPVVRLVNSIISGAVKARASDIHVEPLGSSVRVRYRVDGELQEVMTIPPRILPAVVSRVKVIADMDITEHRKPQDGHISHTESGRSLDLRVSTIPTICGEKVVARIVDRAACNFDFNQLGFPEDEYRRIAAMMSHPHGMILVTGPTGSGKSTTLYTVLTELNRPNRNVVTVEDPVEYQLEGINQIQVDAEFGLGFASALKYLLRQDPDVIMIGEVRDRETAAISVQAALTGHLLLSTMHTNDAVGVVTRLADLGIDAFLIADALVGVVAQRLVRRNCDHCREHYDPSPTALDVFAPFMPSDNAVSFTRGAGCEKCGGSGYLGRMPVFESLVITPTITQAIERGATSSEIQHVAQQEGMQTLVAAGFDRALAGETTVEEVRQKILA